MTVVQDAISAKQIRAAEVDRGSTSSVRYDAVWCVFDVDQHPKIKEALSLAAKNGISVALSNPCFEFWLVLHFEKYSTTGITRHKILSRLKTHITGYAKGENFGDLLLPNLDKAITHAKNIWQTPWACTAPTAYDAFSNNPSTLVHKLVEALKPK